MMNKSLVAHDDVQLLTVDLHSSASSREDMPTQHFVAHNDMQASPRPNPLVSRSIPVDKGTVLEMQRLAWNPPSVVTQAELDANGDKVLVVSEYTNMNPNIQHDLELWNRVCE
jgi:hypothetical protein